MAGIKHKWTSPAADGSDSTKLQPSKWNEDHGTAETNTSLVLAPDGTGGVEFRAEAGGFSDPMTDAGDLIFMNPAGVATDSSQPGPFGPVYQSYVGDRITGLTIHGTYNWEYDNYKVGADGGTSLRSFVAGGSTVIDEAGAPTNQEGWIHRSGTITLTGSATEIQLYVAGQSDRRAFIKDFLLTHDAVVPDALPIGSNGDVLKVVDGLPTWDAVVSEITDIPTAETDTALVLHPDGSGGIVWGTDATGGGGGGLGHSFVGYNTVGGTWTTLVSKRQYCKQITLAADSLVASVDIHVRGSTDNISGVLVAVLTDNAGSPGVLVAGSTTESTAHGGVYLSNNGSMPSAGRWFSMPVGVWLTAGTYWICFMVDTTLWDIANDGSGSDVWFGPGQFIITGGYPSAWSLTTGSVKYSIRASILS